VGIVGNVAIGNSGQDEGVGIGIWWISAVDFGSIGVGVSISPSLHVPNSKLKINRL
jgi:hypothetical protein